MHLTPWSNNLVFVCNETNKLLNNGASYSHSLKLIQFICFLYFRVVQRNLVFVVGLSTRLADPEVLKKHEYFGKFGKIHKVVINQSTSYAGAQVKFNIYPCFNFCDGPTC